MTFTWNIQKVYFYPDQVEHKGQIDLERAVMEFQTFPWEAQLTEAAQREMTSTMPTITFVSDQGQLLCISATDLNHFELYYENGLKCSNLIVSNDISYNPEGIGVEDFIELFFNGQLEENVNLVQAQSQRLGTRAAKYGQIEFSIAETKKLNYLTGTFLWFVANIIVALIVNNSELLQHSFALVIGMQIFFLISWVPGVILYLTYSSRNAHAKFKIDPQAKTAEYSDGNQSLKFSRKDIEFCLLSTTRSYSAPWYNFQNLRIDLKEGKSIWVTCLLADVNQVTKALNLHYKETKCFIPTLC